MRGDLVADVIDVLNLHWLANGKPEKAKIGITLSQVLQYRGVTVATEALRMHWQAMRDARSIRLQDGMIDAALFDMDAAALPAQGNLFGSEEPPGADVVYVYSPGFFIAAALRENREYLAAYTPKLLNLDPYRDNLAKRIGRYLRAEWRMNPEGYTNGRNPRYRTWREHLADAGIEPTGRAGEFITALERDIGKLAEIGAIREWPEDDPDAPGGWLYHPDDQERRHALPYHGKLEAFLSLRIHLPPPADVADELATVARKRLAQRNQRAALAAANEGRKRRGRLPARADVST